MITTSTHALVFFGATGDLAYKKIFPALQAMAKRGATTRTAIDTAAKAGDADTADLCTEVSRGVDKLLWMVEAHSQASN